MIAVARVALREIELPLKEPFRISSGVEHVRRILLIELVDRAGRSAWSECVAGAFPNYSPEAIDTAWIAISEWVAPLVLDTSFATPEAVHDLLATRIRGNPMARAAIEMGCWGLAALAEDRSLAALLGGDRTRVGTGISIGIQDSPRALAERAARAAAAGYRKVKVKIEPGRDLDYVAAAREAVGSTALMVDANNAYTPDDTATLQRLDDFDLSMIEQPLAWDDLRMHAELQRNLRTPICLDESIVSADRAREMVDLAAGRIVNIKPGRVGGFTEARRIHDIAARAGMPVWCGGMLESGIGRAYNVALASLANFSLPGDLSPSARYWERDIVEPEWTMDAEGFVEVPRAPGLGVTIDVDRIDDLTTRITAIGSRT